VALLAQLVVVEVEMEHLVKRLDFLLVAAVAVAVMLVIQVVVIPIAMEKVPLRAVDQAVVVPITAVTLEALFNIMAQEALEVLLAKLEAQLHCELIQPPQQTYIVQGQADHR
jgi:hypothetical protein